MQHNPAPWWIEQDPLVRTAWTGQCPPNVIRIFAPCPPFALGECVAVTRDEANAKLITAAPSLLGALEQLVRAADPNHCSQDPAVKRARDVVQKAKYG